MSRRTPMMRHILAKITPSGEILYLFGDDYTYTFLSGDPRDEKWFTSSEREDIDRMAKILIKECEDFCIMEIVDGWYK